MKIRILHLIGSLRLGGAQVCLRQLVEHQTDPDVTHFVYPLRSRRIDIPIRGNIITRAYGHYDIRKFFTLLKICREEQIDIIHAHLHKAIIGALLATFFCKVKVIVHEHGPVYRKGIQYSFYRWMLRLLKRRAAAVIANSQATANMLIQTVGIPESQIHIIYNAVDLETFKPDPSARESVRQQFGFSDKDIVVGFLGRFHPVKGVDLLVQAMPLLFQKDSSFKLLLLGDGPLRDSLKKQTLTDGTDSHICFAGFQENAAYFMNAFDIACIPSRQEPFGIVALEVMSMNIPLVCSRADGLAELIQDNENALGLTELSPEEIALRILDLSQNESLRKRLQKNASVFCQQYGIPQFVRRIGDAYGRIIKK